MIPSEILVTPSMHMYIQRGVDVGMSCAAHTIQREIKKKTQKRDTETRKRYITRIRSNHLRIPFPPHTLAKAVDPTWASNFTIWSSPLRSACVSRWIFQRTKHSHMSSKNARGSIPCADVKSVPVFFNECIAARIPCTAATADTNEKTFKPHQSHQSKEEEKTH